MSGSSVLQGAQLCTGLSAPLSSQKQSDTAATESIVKSRMGSREQA